MLKYKIFFISISSKKVVYLKIPPNEFNFCLLVTLIIICITLNKIKIINVLSFKKNLTISNSPTYVNVIIMLKGK